jgi:hypothetical protein
MSFCEFVTKQGKPCKNGSNCHLHCNETETCSICLNPARKTRGVKDLRCGHRFHKKCINGWASKGGDTCPMCRKPLDESKFRVSVTIENTERNTTNTWPLPSFSITTLLEGLGLEDFTFGTSEIRMNLENDHDMESFMNELGIRIANFDTLILDTE